MRTQASTVSPFQFRVSSFDVFCLWFPRKFSATAPRSYPQIRKRNPKSQTSQTLNPKPKVPTGCRRQRGETKNPKPLSPQPKAPELHLWRGRFGASSRRNIGACQLFWHEGRQIIKESSMQRALNRKIWQLRKR